jgi:hypothetical protein
MFVRVRKIGGYEYLYLVVFAFELDAKVYVGAATLPGRRQPTGIVITGSCWVFSPSASDSRWTMKAKMLLDS